MAGTTTSLYTPGGGLQGKESGHIRPVQWKGPDPLGKCLGKEDSGTQLHQQHGLVEPSGAEPLPTSSPEKKVAGSDEASKPALALPVSTS